MRREDNKAAEEAEEDCTKVGEQFEIHSRVDWREEVAHIRCIDCWAEEEYRLLGKAAAEIQMSQALVGKVHMEVEVHQGCLLWTETAEVSLDEERVSGSYCLHRDLLGYVALGTFVLGRYEREFFDCWWTQGTTQPHGFYTSIRMRKK